MTAAEIVEIILTQHWKPTGEGVCRCCWVCDAAKRCGLQARSRHMPCRGATDWGRVWVEPTCQRPLGFGLQLSDAEPET